MESIEVAIAGLQTLLKGGPMLFPLLFFSLLAMSIVLERLAYMKRDRLIPTDYVGRVYRLLERGNFKMAVALCETRPMLITEMLRKGIVNREATEAVLLRDMNEYIRQHGRVLYRHLFVLGMVAALSPLLGLLGTVIGMIYSFGALSSGVGDVELGVVADGISIALLTTFAGLVIAVPSIVAHGYLMNRADQYTRELKRYGISLVRFLKSHELRLAAYEFEGQDGDELGFTPEAEDLTRA